MLILSWAGLVVTLVIAIVFPLWLQSLARELKADRDLAQERADNLAARLRETQLPKTPAVDPVALYKAIEGLPSRVLATIQGSINPQQGKVGELLAYAQLRGDYDQVIPLGKPVDFIGFKYGPESHIDFVEVKTGAAKLTPDERVIQAITEIPGGVRFRTIRVYDEGKKFIEGQVD